MPREYSKYWGHGTYFKPGESDLNKANIIFEKCTAKNDLVHSQYKRQYIPYISKNGTKHIKVICFCRDEGINWKKEVLLVYDGGDCFFEVIINLATNTYSDLMINGDG
jgi:hypothetical protein